MRFRVFYLVLLCLVPLLGLRTWAQQAEIPAQHLGLVPAPRAVRAYAATYLLPPNISVYAPGPDALAVAGLLQELLAALGTNRNPD